MSDYFKARGVDEKMYENYILPMYYKEILSNLKPKARILDIGCGFGQTLNAIKNKKYKWGGEMNDFNLFGIDINENAIKYVKSLGIESQTIKDILEFNPKEKFDLIIITHVLEHLPKDNIINTLKYFKENLLNENGSIFIAVPNAQSNTNCYWAYEDFTHTTLFTAGSIIYVLKMAGFNSINIIDKDATQGLSFIKKNIKKLFLLAYKINYKFWNRITSSAFHNPSPQVFSYEIKVLAK